MAKNHVIKNKKPIVICPIDGKNNLLAYGTIEKIRGYGRKVQIIENEIVHFKNDEYKPVFYDSVRNLNAFVMSSSNTKPDTELMRNCQYLQDLRINSAGRLTSIVPYFYWARQEKKDGKYESISAKLHARFLEVSGMDELITLHLHNAAIEGFFDNKPVNNPSVLQILWDRMIAYYAQLGYKFREDDFVIIYPDEGIAKECRGVSDVLNVDCDGFSKFRKEANRIDKMKFLGGDSDSIKGKVCVVIDDQCDTGGTLEKCASNLIARGARKVFVLITHYIGSGDAVQILQNSEIEKFFTTNSLVIPESRKFEKLDIYDLSSFFASIISTVWDGGSIRKYDWKKMLVTA